MVRIEMVGGKPLTINKDKLSNVIYNDLIKIRNLEENIVKYDFNDNEKLLNFNIICQELFKQNVYSFYSDNCIYCYYDQVNRAGNSNMISDNGYYIKDKSDKNKKDDDNDSNKIKKSIVFYRLDEFSVMDTIRDILYQDNLFDLISKDEKCTYLIEIFENLLSRLCLKMANRKTNDMEISTNDKYMIVKIK